MTTTRETWSYVFRDKCCRFGDSRNSSFAQNLRPGRWRKPNGIADVRLEDRTVIRAELHGYEATGATARLDCPESASANLTSSEFWETNDHGKSDENPCDSHCQRRIRSVAGAPEELRRSSGFPGRQVGNASCDRRIGQRLPVPQGFVCRCDIATADSTGRVRSRLAKRFTSQFSRGRPGSIFPSAHNVYYVKLHYEFGSTSLLSRLTQPGTRRQLRF
jgi:hypothetical protein